jgi:hypothetical protein
MVLMTGLLLYVAFLVIQLGLRPLAVHLDKGWDLELAVNNIEKVLNRLGIDLHTNPAGVFELVWYIERQCQHLRASYVDALRKGTVIC